MARFNLVLQVGVVLFLLQNVHSKSRYMIRELMMAPQISLVPINTEYYQQCRYQICKNSEDYPENEILRLMQNTRNMVGMFGIVLNSTYDTTQIDSRAGFIQGKAKKLCNTETSETFLPRVIRNVNLQWKYVVNVKGYYQRFTAEMCRESSMHGKKMMNSKSMSQINVEDYCTGLGFQCQQNHQLIYLLTFENGYLDFDKFWIPTTCNCACGY